MTAAAAQSVLLEEYIVRVRFVLCRYAWSAVCPVRNSAQKWVNS